MTEQLEVIISNLKTCFDEKPWYGTSLMQKLQVIPWQVVNDKLYDSKSIAVLVKHIINWRIFVLKKLAGDAVYNIIIDGANDWDEISVSNELEWRALIEQLQETQNQLLIALSKEDDSLLERQVPGKDYLFGPILTSIAQHDIYHLGQIAMLNAMAKSS